MNVSLTKTKMEHADFVLFVLEKLFKGKYPKAKLAIDFSKELKYKDSEVWGLFHPHKINNTWRIAIRSNSRLVEMEVLAHEIVHFWQTVTRKMIMKKGLSILFCGQMYAGERLNNETPWEVEADTLAEKFVKEYENRNSIQK